MDPGFPTIPMADQEWCLNARCIAAGLPPFPSYNCYFLPHDRQMDAAMATGSDHLSDATPLQHKFPALGDPFRLPKLETAEMGLGATATATAPVSGEAPHPLLLLPPPLQDSPASTKHPCAPPLWKGKRIPESVAARKRRKGISDRTTILAGLMPWERKMSISTMLEEAHKYVRFLEAQVTALRYMPQHSYLLSITGQHHTTGAWEGGGYGALDSLNRQQLLEVMVNSALVQERLYKRGLCVCSVEQMVLMRRRIVERRRLVAEEELRRLRQVEQGSGCSTVSN